MRKIYNKDRFKMYSGGVFRGGWGGGGGGGGISKACREIGLMHLTQALQTVKSTLLAYT